MIQSIICESLVLIELTFQVAINKFLLKYVELKIANKFWYLIILEINKMKIYFYENLSKPITLIIFLISIISFKGNLLNAEYLSEELQIESSTKSDDDESAIPTNPFELVEMIRRYNSLNDATNPSDALDNALEAFNNLEEK